MGAGSSLGCQLALPEPLSGLNGYRFECFTLPSEPGLLVDVSGDGIPDVTAWGTPVHEVHSYTRADGTQVRGHFRTVPDGLDWNNLSSHRH